MDFQSEPEDDIEFEKKMQTRDRRLAEGMCTNGCGPMHLVALRYVTNPETGEPFLEMEHQECAACGFVYYKKKLYVL